MKYVVEGRYNFPTDMLRYEQSWPSSPEDSAKVAINGTDRAYTRIRQVTLYTDRHPRTLTDARWRSFDWRIVSVNDVPYVG